MKGKLVRVHVDNIVAATYANNGAGRPPARTVPSHKVKKIQIRLLRTLAPQHISNRGECVADARPSSALQVMGKDSYPGCHLKQKLHKAEAERRGGMDVDFRDSDDGSHAWRDAFRPPGKNAFEGPFSLRSL